MAKTKQKPEVIEVSEISGYRYENGKKVPIYDNFKNAIVKEGEVKGYTWASGKKEPIM